MAALPPLSAAHLPQTPLGAAGERNRDPQTSNLSLLNSTTRIFLTALQFRDSSEGEIIFLKYDIFVSFFCLTSENIFLITLYKMHTNIFSINVIVLTIEKKASFFFLTYCN